jgi:hypothetical protein
VKRGLLDAAGAGGGRAGIVHESEQLATMGWWKPEERGRGPGHTGQAR